MSARRLHIANSVHACLQSGQVDAIELACMDTCYQPCELTSFQDVPQFLGQNSQDMLLTDAKTLTRLLELGAFSLNEQLILILFDKENPDLKPHAEKLRPLRYLIGANTPAMLRATLSSILEFRATGKARGLRSKLVQVETLSRYQRRVVASSERPEIQRQVIQFYTEQLKIHDDKMVNGISAFPGNMADVLDELLMNAIWDANQARSTVDRSLVAKLDANEVVTVEAACDGQTLSLTVEDSQGTFPTAAFFKPLRFSLGFKDETTVNEGPGGAGLGVFLILKRVAALSIEVRRGKSTRVTAILRGDQSLKETQRSPRTLLYFEES